MKHADRPRLIRAIRRAIEDRLTHLGHTVELEQDELREGMEREDPAREPSDRETSLALLELGESELAGLRAALDRIRQGTYGRCEVCARDIPAERLRAQPTAVRCLDCQRSAERRYA